MSKKEESGGVSFGARGCLFSLMYAALGGIVSFGLTFFLFSQTKFNGEYNRVGVMVVTVLITVVGIMAGGLLGVVIGSKRR